MNGEELPSPFILCPFQKRNDETKREMRFFVELIL